VKARHLRGGPSRDRSVTAACGWVTPAEFEAAYYRQNQPAADAVTQ